MLRKPRLFRLVHLERSYAGELGRHVTAAMDELCADPRPPPLPLLVPKATLALLPVAKREPSPEKVDVKDKRRQQTAPLKPARSVKRKVDDDVIDLLSSDDDDDDDIEVVSASTSTESSSSSSKRTGTSTRPSPKKKTSIFPTPQTTPGPDHKGKGKASSQAGPPLTPSLSADVVRALSLDDPPLELSWFCAGVEREDEERLLRTLQMDELRDVARGMKCWKAGVSVRTVP
jgi:hypothetical protein